MYKTQLCRYIKEKKRCPFGDKCTFAHSEKELKPKVTEVDSRRSTVFDALKTNSSQFKYKTSLCDSFSKTGACRFGAKCNFAHGEKELRKAKCAFGKVCNNYNCPFSHEDEVLPPTFDKSKLKVTIEEEKETFIIELEDDDPPTPVTKISKDEKLDDEDQQLFTFVQEQSKKVFSPTICTKTDVPQLQTCSSLSPLELPPPMLSLPSCKNDEEYVPDCNHVGMTQPEKLEMAQNLMFQLSMHLACMNQLTTALHNLLLR